MFFCLIMYSFITNVVIKINIIYILSLHKQHKSYIYTSYAFFSQFHRNVRREEKTEHTSVPFRRFTGIFSYSFNRRANSIERVL